MGRVEREMPSSAWGNPYFRAAQAIERDLPSGSRGIESFSLRLFKRD